MENQEPEEQPEKQESAWLKNGTGFVAMLGVAVIIASGLHELVYFQVISPEYQSLMVASDYFSATLEWLPTVALAVTVPVIIEMFTKRMERGLTEEEIIQNSSNPEETRKFRESPIAFLKWCLPFFLIISLITPLGTYFGLFSVALGWMVFLGWFLNNVRIVSRISRFGIFFIMLAPPFLLLLADFGYNSAINDLEADTGNYVLMRQDEEKTAKVLLLRSFEVGILVRYPKENKLSVIAWKDIKQIDKIHEKPVRESPLCKWIGICYLDNRLNQSSEIEAEPRSDNKETAPVEKE